MKDAPSLRELPRVWSEPAVASEQLHASVYRKLGVQSRAELARILS